MAQEKYTDKLWMHRSSTEYGFNLPKFAERVPKSLLKPLPPINRVVKICFSFIIDDSVKKESQQWQSINQMHNSESTLTRPTFKIMFAPILNSGQAPGSAPWQGPEQDSISGSCPWDSCFSTKHPRSIICNYIYIKGFRLFQWVGTKQLFMGMIKP